MAQRVSRQGIAQKPCRQGSILLNRALARADTLNGRWTFPDRQQPYRKHYLTFGYCLEELYVCRLAPGSSTHRLGIFLYGNLQTQ